MKIKVDGSENPVTICDAHNCGMVLNNPPPRSLYLGGRVSVDFCNQQCLDQWDAQHYDLTGGLDH